MLYIATNFLIKHKKHLRWCFQQTGTKDLNRFKNTKKEKNMSRMEYCTLPSATSLLQFLDLGLHLQIQRRKPTNHPLVNSKSSSLIRKKHIATHESFFRLSFLLQIQWNSFPFLHLLELVACYNNWDPSTLHKNTRTWLGGSIISTYFSLLVVVVVVHELLKSRKSSYQNKSIGLI